LRSGLKIWVGRVHPFQRLSSKFLQRTHGAESERY
jgi:hypothetical protein